MSVFSSPFNEPFHNPFGSPFNGPGIGGGGAWSPLQYFAASEQGIWLDPSDMSTLFQDSAGTTPVTAVEQPVGKILDKSGRGNHATQATAGSRPKLSARKNWLLASEDFSAATWTKNAVTVVANSATASDGNVTADKLVPPATNAVHQVYASASGVTVAAGQRWTGSVDLKADGCGFCYVEVHGGTGKGFCVNLTTGAITNASAGLIAGTVENLGNGWWRANVTEDTAAAYVYLQLYPRATAGDIAAWLGDGINGVLMSRAQLEAGPTATTYQRVTTATDYDTVGFLHYLKFDGVDDSLSTGSIDFTATDKMTVVAGLTKLSEAAAGIACAVGVNINTTPGVDLAAGPNTNKSVAYGSRGTTLAYPVYTNASISVPKTMVLTGQSDISADICTLRVDGSQVVSSASDQGSGSYGSAAIYIGRRGGTSLPFNGNLYQLVVRGAATADLTPGETFAAGKTGVTL